MAYNITVNLQVNGISGLNTVTAQLKQAIQAGAATPIDVKVNPSSVRQIRQLQQGTSGAGGGSFGSGGGGSGGGRAVRGQGVGDTANLAGLSQGAQQAGQSFREAGSFLEYFGAQSALAARRFAAFVTSVSLITQTFTGVKEGIAQGIEFERTITKIGQLSGETSQRLEPLKKRITDLSTTFGVSSRELSQAAVILKTAGINTADVGKSLRAISEISLTPNFSGIVETSQGAIAIMRQFKISADDLRGAFSGLNAITGDFAVEGRDLIEATKRAGGAFAAIKGESVEAQQALNQFAAVFTAVRATTRESAESIATGLRTIFARLQSGSVVQALEQVGVRLRYTTEEARALGRVDLTGQFVGAYEAIQRLGQATAGLKGTDPRFAAIAEEVGGIRQISRVLPLLQQTDEIQRAYQTGQAGSASLTVSSERAIETLGSQIDQVREKYLAFFRTITDSSGFKDFARSILTVAEGFQKLLTYATPALTILGTFAATRIASSFASIASSASSAFQGIPFATAAPRGVQVPQPLFRASGGIVPGYGDTDSVPARLMPGEYVIRKKAAQSIGYDRLDRLNRAGGGPIRLAGGGTPSRLSAREYLEHNRQVAGRYFESIGVPIAVDKLTRGIDVGRDVSHYITATDRHGRPTTLPSYKGLPHATGEDAETTLSPRLTYVALNSLYEYTKSRRGRPFRMPLPVEMSLYQDPRPQEFARTAATYLEMNRGIALPMQTQFLVRGTPVGRDIESTLGPLLDYTQDMSPLRIRRADVEHFLDNETRSRDRGELLDKLALTFDKGTLGTERVFIEPWRRASGGPIRLAGGGTPSRLSVRDYLEHNRQVAGRFFESVGIPLAADKLTRGINIGKFEDRDTIVGLDSLGRRAETATYKTIGNWNNEHAGLAGDITNVTLTSLFDYVTSRRGRPWQMRNDAEGRRTLNNFRDSLPFSGTTATYLQLNRGIELPSMPWVKSRNSPVGRAVESTLGPLLDYTQDMNPLKIRRADVEHFLSNEPGSRDRGGLLDKLALTFDKGTLGTERVFIEPWRRASGGPIRLAGGGRPEVLSLAEYMLRNREEAARHYEDLGKQFPLRQLVRGIALVPDRLNKSRYEGTLLYPERQFRGVVGRDDTPSLVLPVHDIKRAWSPDDFILKKNPLDEYEYGPAAALKASSDAIVRNHAYNKIDEYGLSTDASIEIMKDLRRTSNRPYSDSGVRTFDEIFASRYGKRDYNKAYADAVGPMLDHTSEQPPLPIRGKDLTLTRDYLVKMLEQDPLRPENFDPSRENIVRMFSLKRKVVQALDPQYNWPYLGLSNALVRFAGGGGVASADPYRLLPFDSTQGLLANPSTKAVSAQLNNLNDYLYNSAQRPFGVQPSSLENPSSERARLGLQVGDGTISTARLLGQFRKRGMASARDFPLSFFDGYGDEASKAVREVIGRGAGIDFVVPAKQQRFLHSLLNPILDASFPGAAEQGDIRQFSKEVRSILGDLTRETGVNFSTFAGEVPFDAISLRSNQYRNLKARTGMDFSGVFDASNKGQRVGLAMHGLSLKETVAHEYGHALDYNIDPLAGKQYASEIPGNPLSDFASVYRNVVSKELAQEQDAARIAYRNRPHELFSFGFGRLLAGTGPTSPEAEEAIRTGVLPYLRQFRPARPAKLADGGSPAKVRFVPTVMDTYNQVAGSLSLRYVNHFREWNDQELLKVPTKRLDVSSSTAPTFAARLGDGSLDTQALISRFGDRGYDAHRNLPLSFLDDHGGDAFPQVKNFMAQGYPIDFTIPGKQKQFLESVLKWSGKNDTYVSALTRDHRQEVETKTKAILGDLTKDTGVDFTRLSREVPFRVLSTLSEEYHYLQKGSGEGFQGMYKMGRNDPGFPDMGKVILTILDDDLKQAVAHEYGHALDYNVAPLAGERFASSVPGNPLSKFASKYRKVVDAEMAAMGPEWLQANKGYQRYRNSPQELFAFGFGRILAGYRDPLYTSPESMKVLDKEVLPYLRQFRPAKLAEGGLPRYPRGQRANLADLMGQIESSFARGTPTGRFLDYPAHALDLARASLTPEVLEGIPRGAAFLGSGVVGLGFREPQGNVLRLQADEAESLAQNYFVRNGYPRRPSSLFTTERPDIEGLLQALSTEKIGSVHAERLPFAYPSGLQHNSDRHKEVIAAINGMMGKRGYRFTDTHPGNLGLLDGLYKVIDPGAITRLSELSTTVLDPRSYPDERTVVRRRLAGGGTPGVIRGGPLDTEHQELLRRERRRMGYGMPTDFAGYRKELMNDYRKAFPDDLWKASQENLEGLQSYMGPLGLGRINLKNLVGGLFATQSSRYNDPNPAPYSRARIEDGFSNRNRIAITSSLEPGLNDLSSKVSTIADILGLAGDYKLGDARGFSGVLGSTIPGVLPSTLSNLGPGGFSDAAWIAVMKRAGVLGLGRPHNGFTPQFDPQSLDFNRLVVPLLEQASHVPLLLGADEPFQPGQAQALRSSLRESVEPYPTNPDKTTRQNRERIREIFAVEEDPAATIARLPRRARRLAEGGEIDSVPALLTPGEFVIRREAASRIGLANLHRLNNAGDDSHVQRFNTGGLVQRFAAGDRVSGSRKNYDPALHGEQVRVLLASLGINLDEVQNLLKTVTVDGGKVTGVSQSFLQSVQKRQATVTPPTAPKDPVAPPATPTEDAAVTGKAAEEATVSRKFGKHFPREPRLPRLQQMYDELAKTIPGAEGKFDEVLPVLKSVRGVVGRGDEFYPTQFSSRFVQQVKNTFNPPPEKENDLSIEERQRYVLQNQGIVDKVMKKARFQDQRSQREDLRQIGLTELVRSSELFQPSLYALKEARGGGPLTQAQLDARFRGYSVLRVQQALDRALKSENQAKYTPANYSNARHTASKVPPEKLDRVDAPVFEQPMDMAVREYRVWQEATEAVQQARRQNLPPTPLAGFKSAREFLAAKRAERASPEVPNPTPTVLPPPPALVSTATVVGPVTAPAPPSVPLAKYPLPMVPPSTMSLPLVSPPAPPATPSVPLAKYPLPMVPPSTMSLPLVSPPAPPATTVSAATVVGPVAATVPPSAVTGSTVPVAPGGAGGIVPPSKPPAPPAAPPPPDEPSRPAGESVAPSRKSPVPPGWTVLGGGYLNLAKLDDPPFPQPSKFVSFDRPPPDPSRLLGYNPGHSLSAPEQFSLIDKVNKDTILGRGRSGILTDAQQQNVLGGLRSGAERDFSRKFLSAQQRLLAVLHEEATAGQILAKAQEDLSKVLSGQATYAASKTGGVLGTTSAVNEAKQRGVTPPGSVPGGYVSPQDEREDYFAKFRRVNLPQFIEGRGNALAQTILRDAGNAGGPGTRRDAEYLPGYTLLPQKARLLPSALVNDTDQHHLRELSKRTVFQNERRDLLGAQIANYQKLFAGELTGGTVSQRDIVQRAQDDVKRALASDQKDVVYSRATKPGESPVALGDTKTVERLRRAGLTPGASSLLSDLTFRTIGELGQRGEPVPTLFREQALRNLQNRQGPGLAAVSYSTQERLVGRESRTLQGNFERDFISAQKRLLAAMYKDSDASERSARAKEDLKRVLSGQATAAFDSRGNVLGLEDTVVTARASGIAIPGAAPTFLERARAAVKGGVNRAASATSQFLRIPQAAAAVNQVVGGAGSSLTTAALFGGPTIAGAAEGFAGRADVAIDRESTGSFRAGKAVSGGVTLGIAGGFLGSFAGSALTSIGGGAASLGPLGAVVGAVVGAGLGIKNALREAASEIRQVELGRALGKFQSNIDSLLNLGRFATNDLKFGAVTNLQKAQTLVSEESTAQASNFFGFADPVAYRKRLAANTRESFGPQLPSFTRLLQNYSENLVREYRPRPDAAGNLPDAVDQVFGQLQTGNGGLNKELLSIIASVKQASPIQVEKEQKETIRQQLRVEEGRRSSVESDRSTVQATSAFSRLTTSLAVATEALQGFADKSRLLGDFFDGSLSPNRLSVGFSNLDTFGRFDDKFTEPLNLIRGAGGEQGKLLYDSAIGLNKVAQVIPGILAQQVSKPRLREEDFINGVVLSLQSQLRTNKGEPNARPTFEPGVEQAIGAVRKGLNLKSQGEGGLFKLLQELSVDSSKFTREVFQEVQNPISSFGREATQRLTDQANRQNEGLVRVEQQKSILGQTQFQGDELGVTRARYQAEIRARQENRRADVLSFVPLSEVERPFQARQERLTKERGIEAVNPERIGERLRKTQEEIIALQPRERELQIKQPGSAEAAQAASKLVELQGQAQNLTQALRQLTEVSQRNAAIQERINVIRRDEDSRLSFGERALSADASEMASLNRGILLARQANANPSAVGSFSADDRRLLLSTLRSLGDSKLSGFSGAPIASDLLRQVVQGAFGGTFGLNGSSRGELAGLQDRQLDNARAGETASKQLATTQSTVIAQFRSTLEQQQKEFFSNLTRFYAQDRVSRLETEKVSLGVEGSRLGKFAESRKLLEGAGIREEGQVRALFKRVEDVGKFQNAAIEFQSFEGRARATRKAFEGIEDDDQFFDAKVFGGSIVPNADSTTRRLLGEKVKARLKSGGVARPDEFVTGFEKFLDSEGETSNLTSLLGRANLFGRGARVDKDSLKSRYAEALNKYTSLYFQGSVPGEGREAQAALNTAGGRLGGIEGLKRPEFRNLLTGPQGGNILEYIRAVGSGQLNTKDLDKNIQETSKRFGDLSREIDNLKDLLAGVRPVRTPIQETANLLDVVPRYDPFGFNPAGLASGGPIHGAMASIFKPRGTDTVPAMLTPGEFVVNRDAAQANKGILERINQARGPLHLADGGMVGYLEGGGVAQVGLLGRLRKYLVDTLKEPFSASSRAGLASEVKAGLGGFADIGRFIKNELVDTSVLGLKKIFGYGGVSSAATAPVTPPPLPVTPPPLPVAPPATSVAPTETVSETTKRILKNEYSPPVQPNPEHLPRIHTETSARTAALNKDLAEAERLTKVAEAAKTTEAAKLASKATSSPLGKGVPGVLPENVADLPLLPLESTRAAEAARAAEVAREADGVRRLAEARKAVAKHGSAIPRPGLPNQNTTISVVDTLAQVKSQVDSASKSVGSRIGKVASGAASTFEKAVIKTHLGTPQDVAVLGQELGELGRGLKSAVPDTLKAIGSLFGDGAAKSATTEAGSRATLELERAAAKVASSRGSAQVEALREAKALEKALNETLVARARVAKAAEAASGLPARAGLSVHLGKAAAGLGAGFIVDRLAFEGTASLRGALGSRIRLQVGEGQEIAALAGGDLARLGAQQLAGTDRESVVEAQLRNAPLSSRIVGKSLVEEPTGSFFNDNILGSTQGRSITYAAGALLSVPEELAGRGARGLLKLLGGRDVKAEERAYQESLVAEKEARKATRKKAREDLTTDLVNQQRLGAESDILWNNLSFGDPLTTSKLTSKLIEIKTSIPREQDFDLGYGHANTGISNRDVRKLYQDSPHYQEALLRLERLKAASLFQSDVVLKNQDSLRETDEFADLFNDLDRSFTDVLKRKNARALADQLYEAAQEFASIPQYVRPKAEKETYDDRFDALYRDLMAGHVFGADEAAVRANVARMSDDFLLRQVAPGGPEELARAATLDPTGKFADLATDIRRRQARLLEKKGIVNTDDPIADLASEDFPIGGRTLTQLANRYLSPRATDLGQLVNRDGQSFQYYADLLERAGGYFTRRRFSPDDLARAAEFDAYEEEIEEARPAPDRTIPTVTVGGVPVRGRIPEKIYDAPRIPTPTGLPEPGRVIPNPFGPPGDRPTVTVNGGEHIDLDELLEEFEGFSRGGTVYRAAGGVIDDPLIVAFRQHLEQKKIADQTDRAVEELSEEAVRDPGSAPGLLLARIAFEQRLAERERRHDARLLGAPEKVFDASLKKFEAAHKDFVPNNVAALSFAQNSQNLLLRQVLTNNAPLLPGQDTQRQLAVNSLTRKSEFNTLAARQDSSVRDFVERTNQIKKQGFNFGPGGDLTEKEKEDIRKNRRGAFPVKPRLFAEGGIVPGAGNQDSVPALLTPGEVVMNRQAVSRLGAPLLQHFNKGGQAGPLAVSGAYTTGIGPEVSQAIAQLNGSIGGLTSSLAQFGTVSGSLVGSLDLFATAASDLARAISTIPQSITLTGTHSVEVRLTGAEGLARLSKGLEDQISGMIRQKINETFARFAPDAGAHLDDV